MWNRNLKATNEQRRITNQMSETQMTAWGLPEERGVDTELYTRNPCHPNSQCHTREFSLRKEGGWGKQRFMTTPRGLLMKGKSEIPNPRTPGYTHARKSNQRPVLLNRTCTLQEPQTQSYFTALPFLRQQRRTLPGKTCTYFIG